MNNRRAELAQIISRADEAVKLANNPLLQSIIQSHKADAFNDFALSGLNEDKRRRECWQKLQGFTIVEHSLQALIDEGKMAEGELQEIDAMKPQTNNPLGG